MTANGSGRDIDEGSTTAMPLISVRNLETLYETRPGAACVLRRIRLDVEDGEFVTIPGRSGAGQSTPLSILGMVDRASTAESDPLRHGHFPSPAARLSDGALVSLVFPARHAVGVDPVRAVSGE